MKNKDYAVVTLENTKIYRPLKLTLNIRDKHGNYHHPSTTIQPQSEANRDRGVEHVASYDISNVPLPLGAGSYAEVTATDPTSSFPYTMALKRHRFVGIPYTDGVNWVNSDYLNITRYEKDGEDIIKQPSGVPGNKDSNPAGYIETIDKKNERVCFLAVINTVNEEVYGVSAHVKHDPYKKFMNKGRRYKAGHDFEYEGHYARDISHFQELAQKTSNALDGINITNRFNRLQALGDLIQTIPYYIHDSAPGGTIPLYELRGDCSEKTALFSDIVLNDPWNHVPAYINCTINGIPHQVIGIDTQDMGSPPENYRGLFTVAPTENQVNNGMPDTEYAFFDMTYNSQIGQKDRGASGPMSIYALGDFSNGNYTYEKDKPEY